MEAGKGLSCTCVWNEQDGHAEDCPMVTGVALDEATEVITGRLSTGRLTGQFRSMPLSELPPVPRLAEMAELEVIDPFAGLRTALSELVGERITAHLAGGMQADGKLTEVGEDMLTLRQGGRPHFVPLAMVCVVVGPEEA